VKPEKGTARLLIARRDLEIVRRGFVRLMELFNVEYKGSDGERVLATFQSKDYPEARRLGAPLIHWLPSKGNIEVEVMMPDGTTISGLGEPMLADEKPDRVVQLVRFGFGRIEETSKDRVNVCYAHS
ncbi:MAG: glutamate--tRNA ligase, partial [Candidatus Bathyarchaeia archaeon]